MCSGRLFVGSLCKLWKLNALNSQLTSIIISRDSGEASASYNSEKDEYIITSKNNFPKKEIKATD